MDLTLLGRIPIDPALVSAADAGKPYLASEAGSPSGHVFEQIVNTIENRLREYAPAADPQDKEHEARKPKDVLRIAVPVSKGTISPYLTLVEKFALVDVAQGKIVSVGYMTSPPAESGVIAKRLKEKGADAILIGDMNERARRLFDQYQIKVIAGIQGDSPEKAVLTALAFFK
jgi:predicted Fe-Mo cluster-binding NifX family protein